MASHACVKFILCIGINAANEAQVRRSILPYPVSHTDKETKAMNRTPTTNQSCGPFGPLAAFSQHPWHCEISTRLLPGENVLHVLEVDLDRHLQFRTGLLILTDKRLISCGQGNQTETLSAQLQEFHHWDLTPDTVLNHSDHAGIGTLQLIQADRCISTWRHTMGRNLSVQSLIKQFSIRMESIQSGKPSCDTNASFCPKCSASLPSDEDECLICNREENLAPSTWTLFRLWRFARPYRNQLLLGFLLMLCATAATMIPPYLTMPLMDEVLIPFQNGKKIEVDTVAFYLGGLLVAALMSWVLGWAKTYVLALVSERIAADLRTTTYEHLLQLSLEYFGGKRTGDLMSRIGSESDTIAVFLSLHALDFVSDVLMITLTTTVLFSINPWLALATLLPLPIIAWLISLVRGRLRTGFEKIGRVWGEVTSVLADTIPGIRVVKAFAQEEREAQRFRTANQHNLQINDQINKTWSLFSPTVSLLTEMGLLVVWAFGIWQVAQGEITVGVLTAFLAYIGRFYGRIDSMSRIVSVTQKAAAATKRIFDILDHISSVPDPRTPVPLKKVTGQISLNEVGFRYGNRAVIRNLSLKIRPGEMIGLVGHSGSGKSTLVNLMCRFYDVSEGSIQIDGVDIRSIRVADYRRHIGLVLQEPFLFVGTIAENIAYARPDATRSEIIAAARAAHAHEFILRLPQGYDSLVGERGQGLSGGEKQRISIARALLIDPEILILDEATSSVDTETEKEIQKALDNLVKGRTTIAIAHRLSTLRKADRLVVMDRGQIIETGTHEDLLIKQGMYYRLYQAQAKQANHDEIVLEGTHATR